jgi:hypothetical protein
MESGGRICVLRWKLGYIHPVTGEDLIFVVIPMGTTNSSAINCRFANNVLYHACQLQDRSKEFQGIRHEHTWRTQLIENQYREGYGHSQVLLGKDDATGVLGMVDDFLIHAQSERECDKVWILPQQCGLDSFAKNKKPSHWHKFQNVTVCYATLMMYP